MARLRIPQRRLRAVARLVQLGDLLARDLPVRGRCGIRVLSGAAHGTGHVLLEFVCERRCALRDPQVVAVRRRGICKLCGDRGLAQLIRCSEESRTQQVRLHGGIQALVDGAQCGRGLGQRVGIRSHEAQGLGGLLDAQGQRLALGLDRRDARQCLLMLGAQRVDLGAGFGQRAFDGQGLPERTACARRLVAQVLRLLSENGHGLGCQGRGIDGILVSEGGGQGRDLVSRSLQTSARRGLGRVEGSHGQRPAGLTRVLTVGCDRILRCSKLGERRADACVLRLGLSQGTPLGQGAGSLARSCRGNLGNA